MKRGRAGICHGTGSICYPKDCRAAGRKDENGETQRVVILLEEIIERNMQSLFLNYDIVASHPFRIMRNADFSLDEEEAVDLLEEIQKQLKKRQWGEAIRLEIESNVDKQLLKILKKELSISSEDIFQISGPLDLTFLMKMYGLDGFDHLKTPKYTPQPVPELMNEDNISPISAKAISCSTIHTRALTRSLILSAVQQEIRKSLPSSRPYTVSAEIHLSLRHWQRQQTTASRFLFW